MLWSLSYFFLSTGLSNSDEKQTEIIQLPWKFLLTSNAFMFSSIKHFDQNLTLIHLFKAQWHAIKCTFNLDHLCQVQSTWHFYLLWCSFHWIRQLGVLKYCFLTLYTDSLANLTYVSLGNRHRHMISWKQNLTCSGN